VGVHGKAGSFFSPYKYNFTISLFGICPQYVLTVPVRSYWKKKVAYPEKMVCCDLLLGEKTIIRKIKKMKIKASVLKNSALVCLKPASLRSDAELSHSKPLWQLGSWVVFWFSPACAVC